LGRKTAFFKKGLDGGGGATRTLPRDGGVEGLHGNPTVAPRPKFWKKDLR